MENNKLSQIRELQRYSERERERERGGKGQGRL
jgi:hypothetical protein